MNFYSAELSTTTTYLNAPPNANMHDWDGGIIAEKLLTPNIPRFETVNVPPDSSSGLSLFSLALPAISLTSNAIYSKPFKFAFLSVGAISPLSVWTANDMFTLLYYLMKFSIHELLVAGTFTAANEDALITKSFTESFVFEYLFNFSLNFIRLST